MGRGEVTVEASMPCKLHVLSRQIGNSNTRWPGGTLLLTLLILLCYFRVLLSNALSKFKSLLQKFWDIEIISSKLILYVYLCFVMGQVQILLPLPLVASKF